MRVAHVIYGLKLGGLETVVTELASRGMRHGVDPYLVAFGEDGPFRESLAQHGIPYLWMGEVKGMAPSTVRALAQAFERFGADVAHAHDLGPWLNAAFGRAFRPKTQVMATFHQLLPPQGKKRLAARAAAYASSALVACGNEVRIDIERWAPRAANVVTIGNGVNLTEASGPEQRARVRSQWGLSPEDIAIGYLGRMHEEKGPHLLLEAFLSRFGTPASRAHLILVGAGPMDAQLRERARGFSNVHFLGEVAVGASRLLAGLDIYAQASLREGRSLSMLEAMAASLPTVAHQLPAVAEIHSEETARLVPLGDTDKLGAALASLAEDEGLRKKMGQAAQKRVQAYSIDSTVAAYVDLYRKACGKA